MALSSVAGRSAWLNESYIHLASNLATSYLFDRVHQILNKVQHNNLSNEILVHYFTTYKQLHLYQAEYTNDNTYYSSYYLRKRSTYRDYVWTWIPHNSFQYYTERGSLCLDSGYIEEAVSLLSQAVSSSLPGTRQYSIATAVLSMAYQRNGQHEEGEEMLIRSAISDIEAAVKENNSIRLLAQTMYERGDINRANRFVKESLENANAFKAHLRNIQTSKLLPIIDRAYTEVIQQQRNRRTLLLLLVSSLSFGLLTLYWNLKNGKIVDSYSYNIEGRWIIEDPATFVFSLIGNAFNNDKDYIAN